MGVAPGGHMSPPEPVLALRGLQGGGEGGVAGDCTSLGRGGQESRLKAHCRS